MNKFKNPWGKGGKYYPKWIEETKKKVLDTSSLENDQNRGSWLISPVGDAPISSEFMSTRTCRQCSNTHGGTDYAVPVGTSVVSTAPGTVVRAYKSDSYGNVVIVNHGASSSWGWKCIYFICSWKLLTSQQGATVNTGE